MISLTLFLLFVTVFVNPQNQSSSKTDLSNSICDSHYYTVESGDTLTGIAQALTGRSSRWTELLAYNQKKIKNPNLIIPGRKMLVPPSFIEGKCDQIETLELPISKLDLDPVEFTDLSIPESTYEKQKAILAAKQDSINMANALRELVEKAKALKELEKKKVIAKAIKEAKSLEIDGLILDETRSKIGKDFFDSFYQSWVKPEDIYGFTIRIIEKPIPGLGSQVEVQVNENLAFQSRLQPQAEAIEQAGKQAVLYAQYFLQNQPKLKVY